MTPGVDAPVPPTRPGYEAIALYAPGTAPCATDASDTINLWGAPPDALAAVRASTVATVAHYPALYNAGLKAPLAAHAGVAAAELVTGCGSDDVIDCALRAFAESGGVVAHAGPTFSMVPVYARANGMTPVAVPLVGDDYAVDVDGLLALDAAVVYLCSPNNPTATPVAREAVRRVVEGARGLVIVDEAYAEYVLADPEARAEVFTPEAPGWGRVLALRTMSKAFGLAGLRVGYGVGSAAVVREVEKARGPFKVTYPATLGALAALEDAEDARRWVAAHARTAVAQRRRLVDGLRALGLEPAPSAAHFTFVPVPDARAVAEALRTRFDVGVRVFAGLPTAVPALAASHGEGFRLNAGPEPVQRRLLDALAAVLDERAGRGAGNGADGERGAGSGYGASAGVAPRPTGARVTVFDYGAGNLHSLVKAFERAGAAVRVETDAARAVDDTDALVLPGVGAFAAAAERLAPGRERMREALVNGLPALGICLGMQLLFDESDEGDGAGLGLVRGRVTRLDARRVPQIGWNAIEPAYPESPDPLLAASGLGIAYYANSYVCRPSTGDDAVIAWSEHEGDRYPAAVRVRETVGVQFHPEKSSAPGVAMIEAFVRSLAARR